MTGVFRPDLVGESREELVIDRDQLMARFRIAEHGAGCRQAVHGRSVPAGAHGDLRLAASRCWRPTAGSARRWRRTQLLLQILGAATELVHGETA